MRKALILILSLGVISTLAATAFAATKSVTVGDNYFVRAKGVPKITVTKGSKLRFNFKGRSPHNAVGVGVSLGSGCSKIRTTGRCTSKSLRKRGTFVIYCSVHGRGDQSMKVRVK